MTRVKEARMISATGSSLSGINAAFKMLDVSANNTANVNTDGFQKSRVNLQEGNGGGVVVNISKVNDPGPVYTDPSGNMATASNAGYIEEIPAQITAKYMLKANMATIKTVDEMQKSVLDIKA